jgi:hypothetical protein
MDPHPGPFVVSSFVGKTATSDEDATGAQRLFTRRTFCAPMRAVSYLFVGYIYDKRRFSAGFIADYWASFEPVVPEERLVQIAVSPRVEAVFYFGGQSYGRMIELCYGCEALLRDGYAEGPGRKQIDNGNTDFQYGVWMASETSDFDVALCVAGEAFEGRAIIRGQAERIHVDGNGGRTYDVVKLVQSPQELGMVVDGSTGFDEEEYQRRLTEKEEPFRPGLLIHDEIGVPRGKVMDAHSNAREGSGTVIWPPGGPVDSAEQRWNLQVMYTPQLPNLPLWAHLSNEASAAAMSTRNTTPRRRRKS